MFQILQQRVQQQRLLQQPGPHAARGGGRGRGLGPGGARHQGAQGLQAAQRGGGLSHPASHPPRLLLLLVTFCQTLKKSKK